MMQYPKNITDNVRVDYGRRFNFFQVDDVDNLLHGLPGTFRHQLCKKFDEVYSSTHSSAGRYRSGRIDMAARVKRLKKISFNLAGDDDAIVEKAREKARACARLPDYEARESYIKAHDLEPPRRKPEVCSQADYRRMACEDWWRKKLRVQHRQGLEACAIQLGMVNAHKEIYCSDNTVFARRIQKKRNQKIMQKVEALNSDGFHTTLAELCHSGVSNPANRRTELMVRCRGYDDYAEKNGHVSMFYTITCPSRMHTTYAKSGKPVGKYDDTLPKEARAYLGTLWTRARAELARHNIRVYGVRVAEPHHDAAPHWHLLLFMKPWQKRRVSRVLEAYAKAENPEDLTTPDAHKARFDQVVLGGIDPKTGKKRSATGYIAKYISKNIDGYQLDFDEYGNDAVDSAERVEAWATTWAIRQFQFQGGVPVTIWRELRKIKKLKNGLPDLPQGIPQLFIDAWRAADSADWCEFIEIMGGAFVPRDALPIQLKKSSVGVKPNKYGEVKKKYMAFVVKQKGQADFVYPLKSFCVQWEFNFKQGDNNVQKISDVRQRRGMANAGAGGEGYKRISEYAGYGSRECGTGGSQFAREQSLQNGSENIIENRNGFKARAFVFDDYQGNALKPSEVKQILHPPHTAHVACFFRESAKREAAWSSVNNCTGIAIDNDGIPPPKMTIGSRNDE